MSFTNQVIVITGASGAKLVLAARNERCFPALVGEIHVKGRQAFPLQQFDRSSPDREDNALYHAGYGLHERERTKDGFAQAVCM